METRDRQQLIDEETRFLSVVALAMVFSVLVFVGLAWFLLDRVEDPLVVAALPAPIAWAGALAAVALLVAAPLIHRRLLQRIEGPGPEGDPAPVVEGHRFATILVFMLREAAAILGLMIALVSGQAIWVYGLGGLALVAMFTAWPRRDELERLFRVHRLEA
jgi:hypothetical protein